MSLHRRTNGARVTAANLATVATDLTDPDPLVRITEDLILRSEYSGGDDATAATGDDKVQRAYKVGDVVRKSKVLALLTPAMVKSVLPVSGPAAGGTPITIEGDGLDGVTAGTLGGTALTSVVVVNPRKVTAVAPAHAAGLVNLVLTDDSGAVTKTGAYTYV